MTKKIMILCILAISAISTYGQIPLGHHVFEDNSERMDIRELIYMDVGIYCIAGVQKPDTSRFEYRSYKLDTDEMSLDLIDTLVQQIDIRGGYTSDDQSFFELPNSEYFCNIADIKLSYAMLDSAFHFKSYMYTENEVGRVYVMQRLKLANDSTIAAVVEVGPDNDVRDRYIYNYDLDFNVRWRRLLPRYLNRTFLGDMDIIRDSIIVVSQYSLTYNDRPVENEVSIHAISMSNQNFINKIVASDTTGAIEPQIVYNPELDIVVLSAGEVFKLFCCNPQFIHGSLALDSDWEVLWQERQSFVTEKGSTPDTFDKSTVSSDGQAIVSAGPAIDDGWTINISKTGWDGDSIWTRRIVYDFGLENTAGDPRLWDFDASPDGGYALSGRVSYNASETDRRQEGWILKVDSLGCVVAGCDDLVSTMEPSLSDVAIKVFPNPSADQFQFVIGSSMPTEGKIRIISPQGQVIRTYDYTGGHTTYTVSLGDEASGTYILQFSSRDGVVSERMIKI